ncbi:MAG: hypothetical protein CVU39_23705 [Chloroflexi bacterium HGW-Chloroflexi-10]|nr:MAG: hypothetical protein CVU39_23705 [Chloroflexi bacterium HGW-Chloroflexi-10]
MIKSISIIPIIAATIAAAIGMYYIYLYIKGLRQSAHLAFGLSSIAVFFYAMSTFGIYNATNLTDSLNSQRLSVCAFVIFTLSYFTFLMEFTQTKSKSSYIWALRIFGLLIILSQIFIQNELTWISSQTNSRIINFFGEKIPIFESIPGVFTNISFGLGIFIYPFALYIIFNSYKHVAWKKNHPLMISTIIIFSSFLNDTFVAIGFYNFIYLLEISFISIIIYIALLLSRTVNEAAAMKEKLEAAIVELENGRKELESKVLERTQEFQFQAEYFRSLVENSPIAIVALDNNQRVTNCNHAFEILFGYTFEDAYQKDLDSLIASEEVYQDALALTEKVLASEKVATTGMRKRKDDSMVHVSISGVPVIVNKKKLGVLGIYQDISARIEAEQFLRESEIRYRSLFEDSPISLWEEDFSRVKIMIDIIKKRRIPDYKAYFTSHLDEVKDLLQLIRIINVNQATLKLFGALDKTDLISGLCEIIPEDSLPIIAMEFAALAQGETSFISEIDQKNFQGETLHVILRLSIAPGSEDTWEKVFVSIIDITERKMNESFLEYLSHHDQLTGLANRALLFDRLSQAIARARRNQNEMAVFFIDLDGFKQINDRFGHAVGDQLLMLAARRLQQGLRDSDTVARVGGDEFVLALENFTDRDAITPIAEKFLETIAKPYQIQGNICHITASIGIAIYPLDGNDPEQLITNADTAMYRSKQWGKNQVRHFSKKNEDLPAQP